MLLILAMACNGGSECGPGTHDQDGLCVPDSIGDSGGDTGASGPCAPPDPDFWGALSADQVISTPYPSSYDAGLQAVSEKMPIGGQSSPAERPPVTAATVVAWGTEAPSTPSNRRFWVADANKTIEVMIGGNAPESATPGTKVSFGTRSFVTRDGEHFLQSIEDFEVVEQEAPIHVAELGTEALDYEADWGQLYRAHGELIGDSGEPCSTGWTCFAFDHGGEVDHFRVRNDNPQGLVPSSTGGCVELVAPLNYIDYDPDGDDFLPGVNFLDVVDFDMLRTW